MKKMGLNVFTFTLSSRFRQPIPSQLVGYQSRCKTNKNELIATFYIYISAIWEREKVYTSMNSFGTFDQTRLEKGTR